MLPDPKVMCPATGFAKSCRSILGEFDCPKFVKIVGTDPNTGAHVDKSGCVDSFLPMLLIENSQQQRQTAAAVESFRNETVVANERAVTAMAGGLAALANEVERTTNEFGNAVIRAAEMVQQERVATALPHAPQTSLPKA